jgi:CheY-like chemotaxis protein
MIHKALIIDDDPGIVEEVADIVESLGHESASAECMHSARERLGSDRYDYILLDLEIPVRAGRNIARIQNGVNLLKEIRDDPATGRLPVIVMTGHGNDGPEQAVEVMRAGATDYIAKPFMRSKRPFDEIIRDALPVGVTSAGGRTARQATSGTPHAFDHGEMVFYSDRVELNGVKVCGKTGIMRTILTALREKHPNGRYHAFSGDELARRAKSQRGQNAAAEAIRGFRQKTQQALLEELGIECGVCDVIENDRRHGYRFSRKIDARDHDDVAPARDQGDESVTHRAAPEVSRSEPNGEPKDEPNSEPIVSRNEPNGEPKDEPNSEPIVSRNEPNREPIGGPKAERPCWILDRLAAGQQVRRGDLEDEFNVSTATAKRDFRALQDAGRIELVGSGRASHYRLAGAAS